MSTTKDPQQKKAPVIQINQEVLHDNLSGYVRKNLENVLNELLDAEADRLCHAKRYERNAERASTVSFHSKCKVWEQRPDTVRQFKEPCQCGVPRIVQGAA